jgi:hypothetical protein
LEPTFSLRQRPPVATARKPKRTPADPAAPLHSHEHITTITAGSEKSNGYAISTTGTSVDDILSIHPALGSRAKAPVQLCKIAPNRIGRIYRCGCRDRWHDINAHGLPPESYELLDHEIV